MPHGLFYWVLNASVFGSLCGLFLLAARRIRRLPRSVVYGLWAIPFLRFWLPFGYANPLSFWNLLPETMRTTVILANPGEVLPELTMTNTLTAARSYFPVEYKTDGLTGFFSVAALLWVTVALAALFAAAVLSVRARPKLDDAERIGDRVYRSETVRAPAVYGVCRARIVVPPALSARQLPYVLLHEEAHIRRRDNFWRLAAVVTACVHWFNPLVWIFLKAFFEDMELSCDRKVICRLDREQAKEYALTVLSVSRASSFCFSAFGGAGAKKRIEEILSYRKLTMGSALSLAALILIAGIALLTNAAG